MLTCTLFFVQAAAKDAVLLTCGHEISTMDAKIVVQDDQISALQSALWEKTNENDFLRRQVKGLIAQSQQDPIIAEGLTVSIIYEPVNESECIVKGPFSVP